jgi:hypothetical protein
MSLPELLVRKAVADVVTEKAVVLPMMFETFTMFGAVI